MINILCDSLLHSRHMAVLGDDDAVMLKESTEEVIRKCKTAGKIAGLNPSSEIAKSAYDTLDKLLFKRNGVSPEFLKPYLEFERIYQKELDIEDNSNLED